MLRRLTPGRLALAGLILAAVVAAVLWLAPSGDYIFLLVKVAHPKNDHDGGAIYFVDVFERKATLLERLFPGIRSGATVVPASAVNPPGTNDLERRTVDLREMAQSQQIAAAVALKALGYDVAAEPNGVLVAQVIGGTPAVGGLRPTDVIVAVDGKAVKTPLQLRARMALHRPGDRVRLTVRSSSSVRTVTLRTIADPGDRTRALIGIVPAQAASINLPVPVTIITLPATSPIASTPLTATF